MIGIQKREGVTEGMQTEWRRQSACIGSIEREAALGEESRRAELPDDAADRRVWAMKALQKIQAELNLPESTLEQLDDQEFASEAWVTIFMAEQIARDPARQARSCESLQIAAASTFLVLAGSRANPHLRSCLRYLKRTDAGAIRGPCRGSPPILGRG